MNKEINKLGWGNDFRTHLDETYNLNRLNIILLKLLKDKRC